MRKGGKYLKVIPLLFFPLCLLSLPTSCHDHLLAVSRLKSTMIPCFSVEGGMPPASRVVPVHLLPARPACLACRLAACGQRVMHSGRD